MVEPVGYGGRRAMGFFKKRASDPGEIERLRAEITAMSARLQAADQRLEAADQRLEAANQRLEAAEQAKHELGARVNGIVSRLDTPIGPPPHEPPPPPPPSIDPIELAAVRERLEELVARFDGLDARITSVSTELANQIDELSSDVDAIGARAAPTDEVVDELRDAQTRLANEQARYQIAFRHDLADLADRLRRS